MSPNFLPVISPVLPMLEDVSLDLVVDLAAVRIVLGAGFGGDGEALRNRHTEVGHFSQTGALAAQHAAQVSGTITMVKEDGRWKASAITLNL